VADEQSGRPGGRPVDVATWRRLAEGVLATEGVRGDVELSVLFVDEAHMADLNARFMGGVGSTDVLSFPLDGPPVLDDAPAPGVVSPGREDPDPDDLPLLLGDVVICPAVAERNAAEHTGSYEDELALLLVHGILHVLGHDHAEPEARALMQRHEHDHLVAHWRLPPRDPWEPFER
jgi:probable rRNA maturation factor